MEQKAKSQKLKTRGKVEEKRKEKAKENRKIATGELIKRFEKAETRLKKKADKNGRSWKAKQRLEKQKQVRARKRENEGQS